MATIPRDLIDPSAPTKQPAGRLVPTCSLCGFHGGIDPELVVNHLRRCPACQAEWTILESQGFVGRRLVAAWNARRIERTAERWAALRCRKAA